MRKVGIDIMIFNIVSWDNTFPMWIFIDSPMLMNVRLSCYHLVILGTQYYVILSIDGNNLNIHCIWCICVNIVDNILHGSINMDNDR